jgi:YHS domain-containing protein
MTRSRSPLPAAVLLACAVSAGSLAHASDDPADARVIPAPFAPLEYLIGEWKGQAMPKDHTVQQFRGWTEKHAWAWIFSKGKPTGLSFTIKDGKVLASGKLTFDPQREIYRLEGRTPGEHGKIISFEGKLDSSGKQLVLDQTAEESNRPPADGQLRISLRPNANYLRYTMMHDRKEPGAPLFTRTTEVGVTKAGETFAAGASSTERPKCIVTGGAATMSVSFEGRTFPLCCSGCLGEFNDNPQKYVKKAALMLANQAGKSSSGSAPRRKRGRDDAFAGDVDESSESPRLAAKPKKADSPHSGKAAKADEAEDAPSESAKSKEKSEPKKEKDKDKDAAKTPAAKSAARAATLLRLGRTLERAGKTDQALANYREIVKDYSDTPSAKTAAERIKGIEGKE